MKVEISFDELATVRRGLKAVMFKLGAHTPLASPAITHDALAILDRYLATPADQLESDLKQSIRRVKETKCQKIISTPIAARRP